LQIPFTYKKIDIKGLAFFDFNYLFLKTGSVFFFDFYALRAVVAKNQAGQKLPSPILKFYNLENRIINFI
jgi:hypothetical protein